MDERLPRLVSQTRRLREEAIMKSTALLLLTMLLAVAIYLGVNLVHG